MNSFFWNNSKNKYKHDPSKRKSRNFSTTQTEIGYWWALGLSKPLLLSLHRGIKVPLNDIPENIPRWHFSHKSEKLDDDTKKFYKDWIKTSVEQKKIFP